MIVDGSHPADAEDQQSSPPAFQIIILVSMAYIRTYGLGGSELRLRHIIAFISISITEMLHIANEPMSVSGVYLHLSCAFVVAA